MPAPFVGYERSVLSPEKDLLDSKKEAFFGAFPGSPLFCKAVEDPQKRRWILIAPFNERDNVLAKFPLDALTGVDVGTLQQDLEASKYPPI